MPRSGHTSDPVSAHILANPGWLGAPAGMFSITQTSDGFLWLVSLPGDVYRFDGVRFVRWPVPPGVSGKVLPTPPVIWVASDEFVRLEKWDVSAIST